MCYIYLAYFSMIYTDLYQSITFSFVCSFQHCRILVIFAFSTHTEKSFPCILYAVWHTEGTQIDMPVHFI